ncbi:MAG: branched-chain amino acid ABC transporter permease [Chloroflexi bacterium]|nr:branched-chain amino acid ABC transporter permease [Chloroflexota bacterium]
METVLVQTFVNALMLASFYCAASIGLTLVYGVMRILNFTHGEFYMLGAYAVWFFYTKLAFPFLITIPIAIVAVAIVAAVAYLLIFRRLQGRLLEGFLASIGLSFAIQVVVGQTLGGLFHPQLIVNPFPGVIRLVDASVALNRIAVIPFAVVALGSLGIFLQRTRIGRAVRACAQDREAASLQGVNVQRVNLIAFALAAALAAAAGTMMSPLVAVTPYMGLSFIWKTFIIVIVGGMGNLRGTVLAAVVFGFLDGILLSFFDAVVVNLFAVLVLFIVITTRPEGLLGGAK